MKYRIICLLAAALLCLTACSVLTNEQKTKDPTPGPMAHAPESYGYRESDNLLSLWEGFLPPVHERLPAEPLQVHAQAGYQPVMSMAVADMALQKAATWAALQPATPGLTVRDALREPVIEYRGGLQPNLFVDWQSDEAGITHTFTIREGVRWSDGTPVTSNDVRFALEDVWGYAAGEALVRFENPVAGLTEKTFPAPWSPVWNFKGEETGVLPTFERIDDLQFRITYPQGDLGLPMRMALADNGSLDVLMPSEFLKQFHILYVAEKDVWRLMRTKEALSPDNRKFVKPSEKEPEPMEWPPEESWAYHFFDILDQRCFLPMQLQPLQPVIPSLTAWIPKPWGEGHLQYDEFGRTGNTEFVTLQPAGSPLIEYIRNPYYWKIDDNRQQLPYADRLTVWSHFLNGAPDDKTQTWLFGTQFNFNNRSAVYMPTLIWHADVSDPNGWSTWLEGTDQTGMVWQKNVTTNDGLVLSFIDVGNAEWTRIVTQPAFRKALSMALHRDSYNETTFDGRAQNTSVQEDIEQAKELLASCALPDTFVLKLGMEPQQAYLLYPVQEQLLGKIANDLRAIGLQVELVTGQRIGEAFMKLSRVPVGVTGQTKWPIPFFACDGYREAVKTLGTLGAEDYEAGWDAIAKAAELEISYVLVLERLPVAAWKHPGQVTEETATMEEVISQAETWSQNQYENDSGE